MNRPPDLAPPDAPRARRSARRRSRRAREIAGTAGMILVALAVFRWAGSDVAGEAAGPPALPTVTARAVSPQIAEQDPERPGIVVVERTGSTTSALNVNYTLLSGTTDRLLDYVSPAAGAPGGDTADTLTVTIPAGSATTNLVFTPKRDTIPETTETIDVAISTAPRSYRLAARRNAVIRLLDGQAARVPAAPTALVATPVSRTQVNLAWTDNATNEDGYRIEARTAGSQAFAVIATVPADAVSHAVTGIPAGSTATYRVFAFGGAGRSSASNAVTARAVRPTPATPRRNVTVASERGRFKGWPGNGGMWSWGDEIVVMYSDGRFRSGGPRRTHAFGFADPVDIEQARSRDGGRTWTIEREPIRKPGPPGFPWNGRDGPAITDLRTPVDFADPDLAIHVQMADQDYGESYWYYSTDRARTWNGPYRLPKFGFGTVNARTDYVVEAPDQILLLLSGTQNTTDQGGSRAFAVRSTDGGRTWAAVSAVGSASSIQPSTVRVGADRLLSISRTGNVYASDDDGTTWTFRSQVSVPGLSTPFNLVRLADGRIVVTYGFRAAPYGIRAQVSLDQGRTWGDEVVLRDDGGSFDLGYPRSVVRPDGSIVTAYYFDADPTGERTIEATIWDPDRAFSGAPAP